MKKIIIAVAIVCATVAVHAATYNWSVYTTTYSFNGYDAPETGKVWSGATATSMAYYLIDASKYSQKDMLTAIREGGDWSSAVLASGTTGADGTIASQKFTTEDTASLTAYVLLINSAGDYAYMNGSVTKTGDASGGQVDFMPTITTSKVLRDDTGTAAYGSAGWYSTVPEPTSGLLLLIGMGALALRRKQK